MSCRGLDNLVGLKAQPQHLQNCFITVDRDSDLSNHIPFNTTKSQPLVPLSRPQGGTGKVEPFEQAPDRSQSPSWDEIYLAFRSSSVKVRLSNHLRM